jgi:preprotein translocase SecE subunit
MHQVIKFLQEVRAEFRNITWPKRDSLINLTIVVISISIIVSLILGSFDYLFTQGVAYLGNATIAKPAVPTINQTLLPTLAPSPVVTVKPTHAK